jgi:hypothetical protein
MQVGVMFNPDREHLAAFGSNYAKQVDIMRL